MYIYIYMGIHCFTAPNQCFQVARFRDVVHMSEMLCTFPSSCARFTSPLMTFWGDQTKFSDMCIYIYYIHI